ncbi:MAG: glycosyltransferase family 39 protein [Acidobacteriota bacterium]
MSKYGLIAALLLLYLTSLGSVGFVAPDEPRYASIGREMARSGDWITPRLDHKPWFEKPPLLYWTTAIGNSVGLSDEWAARLPLALISLAFLWFFCRTVEREFSPRVAVLATAILGTSAGWVALSYAAVTDLPMSACLNAAMLIAVFGPKALSVREKGLQAQGYAAGALLGLAVLAKAFVPLVLIFWAFVVARGKRWPMIIGSLLVAVPWHVLCYLRNGSAFWDEYFWKQQVGRFFSPTLEHVHSIWYYFPIILVALFPWTPLLGLLFRGKTFDDERVRFLLLNTLFGLLFFSLSTNKLATYMLPLLPGLAIVMAVGVDRARNSAPWLASCVALLAIAPTLTNILPEAILNGLSRVDLRWSVGWPFLIAAAVVGWLAWPVRNDVDSRGRREWAILTASTAAILAILYLKSATLPALDENVSVRRFARAHVDGVRAACLDRDVRRSWEYGLNYYAERSIPRCADDEAVRIVSTNGKLAMVGR